MTDPGPQWLIWAQKLKAEHKELLGKIEQTSEAVATAGVLQERIDSLSTSYTTLHKEVKTLQVDSRSFTENKEVERNLEAKVEKASRRVTKLEIEQGGFLKALDQCRVLATKASEDQNQEVTRWKSQSDLAIQQMKETQTRELDDLRTNIAELRNLIQNHGKYNQIPIVGILLTVVSDLHQVSRNDKISPRPAHRHLRAQQRDFSSDDSLQGPSFSRRRYNHRKSGRLSDSPGDVLDVAQSNKANDPQVYDEGSIISLENNTPPEETLVSHSFANAAEHSEPDQTIIYDLQRANDIEPQGIIDLEEYLIISEDLVLPSLQEFEKRRIQEFIVGMNDANQRAALMGKLNKKAWTLEEYLKINEDIIRPSLQVFEEKRIRQFIDGMDDSNQRATLIENLDEKGWTWKLAHQEVMTIARAEKRRLEEEERAEIDAVQEEAAREVAEESERETRRPQPKGNTQRKKRKRKNW